MKAKQIALILIPLNLILAYFVYNSINSEVEFQELLEEADLSSIETQFIKLRLEGLTMEEITEDLNESAYKIRQVVREKLQGVLKDGETKTA